MARTKRRVGDDDTTGCVRNVPTSTYMLDEAHGGLGGFCVLETQTKHFAYHQIERKVDDDPGNE